MICSCSNVTTVSDVLEVPKNHSSFTHFPVNTAGVGAGCIPLSSYKQCLTSFPTAAAYSLALLERKRCARSKLSFYAASRAVGRVLSTLKSVRNNTDSSGYDDDEYDAVEQEERAPVMHVKADQRTSGDNRTTHFGMSAPGSDYIDGRRSLLMSVNSVMKTRGILQNLRMKEPMENTGEQSFVYDDSREQVQNTYQRRQPERRYVDEAQLVGKQDGRRKGSDRLLRSYVSRTTDSQDQTYGEDTEVSDQWHTGTSTFDSVLHDSHDRKPKSKTLMDRDWSVHSHRNDSYSGRTSSRNLQKQVRFSESVRSKRYQLTPESSFSDNDTSVEHLYRSPQYAKTNLANSFNYSEKSGKDNLRRPKYQPEEYTDEFESDHSNYCNSCQDKLDGSTRNTRYSDRRLHRFKQGIPRLASSFDDSKLRVETIGQESYRNNSLYRQRSDPLPQPLPVEEGHMLERYLAYFGVGMEDIPIVTTARAPFSASRARHVGTAVKVSQGRSCTG